MEPRTFELVPARTALRRLATSLMPMAKQLGCLHRLASIMELSIQPGGSEIQISNLKRLGNLSEVTRCLVDRATKGSEATVDHKAMHAPDAGCFDLNLSNQATAGARLVV